jgi:hypothetical protein
MHRHAAPRIVDDRKPQATSSRYEYDLNCSRLCQGAVLQAYIGKRHCTAYQVRESKGIYKYHISKAHPTSNCKQHDQHQPKDAAHENFRRILRVGSVCCNCDTTEYMELFVPMAHPVPQYHIAATETLHGLHGHCAHE